MEICGRKREIQKDRKFEKMRERKNLMKIGERQKVRKLDINRESQKERKLIDREKVERKRES